MAMTRTSNPPRISEAWMRRKSEYFVDVQLWPGAHAMNPSIWLSNFTPDEMEYAANMLNTFIFLNGHMTDSLFGSSFMSISEEIGFGLDSMGRSQEWSRFRNEVIVTHVVGEVPGPSKSGYLFSRKARQILGIPASRILEPGPALEVLSQTPKAPVLFVDDFVGSGEQMINMWRRPFQFAQGGQGSFEELMAKHERAAFYCPMVCTSYGRDRIRQLCRGLVLKPVHELDETYSYVNEASAMWPESLRDGAEDFLIQASRRAGILNECALGWKGFHSLGMGLAFSHSVPDATLPLFYWARNGWHPLVRRS